MAGRVEVRLVRMGSALGVGAGAIHLGGRGGRQEEKSRWRCPRPSSHALHFGAVNPERGGLGLVQVPDDQPVELGQGGRGNDAFWPSTAGFWPIAMNPWILPWDMATNIGRCEWSPTLRGSQPKP